MHLMGFDHRQGPSANRADQPQHQPSPHHAPRRPHRADRPNQPGERTPLTQRIIPRLAKIPFPGRLTHAHLDKGLDRIANRLGMDSHHHHPHRMTMSCQATSAADKPHTVYYAPDMDGQAAPGEVVWFTAPTTPPSVQPLLIVARAKQYVIGLLISSDSRHAKQDNWLGIGSGAWDPSGQPTWVRLDKVITVPEIDVRRQAAIIPRHSFERIAHRLQADFGWR